MADWAADGTPADQSPAVSHLPPELLIQLFAGDGSRGTTVLKVTSSIPGGREGDAADSGFAARAAETQRHVTTASTTVSEPVLDRTVVGFFSFGPRAVIFPFVRSRT